MPKAVLFLGKCGGLKRKNELGDLVLPIAAIRGEGTSNDYLLPEVPALPAFSLQRAVSTMIRDLGHDYWTGTVYTTNRRVWEHDDDFKEYLRSTRCMAIDMETATIFAAGFANRFRPARCCWSVDQPMIPEGVKTEASDRKVTDIFVEAHSDRHRGPPLDPAQRQERQAPAVRGRTGRGLALERNPDYLKLMFSSGTGTAFQLVLQPRASYWKSNTTS